MRNRKSEIFLEPQLIYLFLQLTSFSRSFPSEGPSVWSFSFKSARRCEVRFCWWFEALNKFPVRKWDRKLQIIIWLWRQALQPIRMLIMVMKMMRKMRDEVMMMMILGFHCVQNNGKMSPKFCITIELNSRKTFFASYSSGPSCSKPD